MVSIPLPAIWIVMDSHGRCMDLDIRDMESDRFQCAQFGFRCPGREFYIWSAGCVPKQSPIYAISRKAENPVENENCRFGLGGTQAPQQNNPSEMLSFHDIKIKLKRPLVRKFISILYWMVLIPFRMATAWIWISRTWISIDVNTHCMDLCVPGTNSNPWGMVCGPKKQPMFVVWKRKKIAKPKNNQNMEIGAPA